MEAKQSGVSFDALCEAVGDIQRRQVLVGVRNHAPGQEIDPRATLTAADHGPRLFNVHLPKLATQGFIEWDQDVGVVSRGPAFDEIEPFLALLTDHQEALPFDFLQQKYVLDE